MITPEYSESMDSVDGPFAVHSNQLCSCCGNKCSTVVRNVRDELVYECCRTCGLDRDHPSTPVIYN